MKETIIFAPGCNGTEILRTLARFGRNTLGVRVLNSTALSRIALMRFGVSLKESFLSQKEAPSVYNSFLRKIPYFASSSYSDCEQIASAVFSMRSLIPENEEEVVSKTLSGGEFVDKNLALKEAYSRYLKAIKKDGYIDSVGLTRKAISEAEPLNADFIILKEFPLSPLNKKLLETLSGGSFKEISFIELFEKEKQPLSDVIMTNAYGASNEIEDILGFIFKNNIPLDQCVIAATDCTIYGQLIHDIAQQYKIPVTFGQGIPIANSNPAEILKLLDAWNTKGFHGIDALERLLMSSAFDRKKLGLDGIRRICEVAGQLRISYNGEENQNRIKAYRDTLKNEEDLEVLEKVSFLAEELAKGCKYIISTYSRIRKGFAGRVDRSAIGVINDMLDVFLQFSNDDIGLIIPDILSKTVCSEISREGELFVTTIGGAISSLRPYLFIIGLSASNFPGSPTENYLLLDSDYLMFGKEEDVPTSVNKIQMKKTKLEELLYIAASLGVRVRMSYSGYQLADHKEDNPSSVLFEIYQAIHAESTMDEFRTSLRQVGFFDQPLSGCSGIGHAYNSSVIGESDSIPAEEEIAAADMEKAWSPSALETFFSCPRHFYLTRILKLREPEEDDPFTIINANQLGSLAHTQMEHLAEKHVSKKKFLERAEKEFDDFLKSRPPLHPEAVKKEKQTYLRMMENAYDCDPKNEVISAEEKWTVEHTSGVTLFGYPDRIEKKSNGDCLVADYKTKRKVEHVEDDPDSCLQVLLYAYMAEQQGYRITSCEYRYIRQNVTVTCRYDETMKAALAGRLQYFRECLETAHYPCNPGKNNENCKYCKCADICGRDREEVAKI